MTDDPFRQMIEDNFVVERIGWAADRVQRATDRLQPDVAPGERFETLVVWFDDHNAFTRDGRTLYFSRRLLERLPDDDAAAFIIGHEIAHHRLGHIPQLSSRWSLARRVAWGVMRELWITSAERERDADLLAIEMCLDAGYDLDRCLGAMAHLENVQLDYGQVNAVVADEHAGVSSHPPIRARVDAIRAHAAEVRAGRRFPLAQALARERARRRNAVLIAAGGAAASVGLFLLLRRPDPAALARLGRLILTQRPAACVPPTVLRVLGATRRGPECSGRGSSLMVDPDAETPLGCAAITSAPRLQTA